MAFNMMEALAKSRPKEDAAPKATQAGKNRLNIRYISAYDLEPSEDNFYSTQQIEELKWAIEMQGVLQNLTVVPLGSGKYRVKAGHRRRLACIALVEEGKKEFEFVPCDVRQEPGDDEEKTLQERLLLILTNLPARQLSDWEQVRQYEELEDIIKALKKREKLPGRVRELIAEKMQRSPSQVSRYEAVSKRLSPAFKAELKNEGINISTAVEIAALPMGQQEELYRDYKKKGALSIKDARQAKEETVQPQKGPEPDERPIPGQIDFDGGIVPEVARPRKADPARPAPQEERPQPQEIPAPPPMAPDTSEPEKALEPEAPVPEVQPDEEPQKTAEENPCDHCFSGSYRGCDGCGAARTPEEADTPPEPPTESGFRQQDTSAERQKKEETPPPPAAPLAQQDEAEKRAVAVSQLKKLRSYCEYMAESDENGSDEWVKDVDALEVAIARLKRG